MSDRYSMGSNFSMTIAVAPRRWIAMQKRIGAA